MDTSVTPLLPSYISSCSSNSIGMASSKQVVLLAAVAAVACLGSLASAATLWMVGDEGGWRAKFSQTGWPDGKTFRVGDSLLFKYHKENHTVVQVGKDDFAACNLQGNLLKFWDSGNDVVPLDKPGKMWFICTKRNHCRKGMKLAIHVVDSTVVAPSPSPVSLPFPGTATPSPSLVSPSTPAAPPPPFWQSTPPPPSLPRSAAVRNPVGSAVAMAAAAVVAAALAF